jgi:hypothetical protein
LNFIKFVFLLKENAKIQANTFRTPLIAIDYLDFSLFNNSSETKAFSIELEIDDFFD